MRLLPHKQPLSASEQEAIHLMLVSVPMRQLIETVKANAAIHGGEAVNFSLRDGRGEDHKVNITEHIEQAREFDTFLRVLAKIQDKEYQFVTVSLQPE